MTQNTMNQTELLIALRNGEILPERSTAYWTDEESRTRTSLQRRQRTLRNVSPASAQRRRDLSAVDCHGTDGYSGQTSPEGSSSVQVSLPQVSGAAVLLLQRRGVPCLKNWTKSSHVKKPPLPCTSGKMRSTTCCTAKN